MQKGDRVKFTGHQYAIAQIYNYTDKFKDKELIIEDIQICPCDQEYMNKLKFEGIEGYYRMSFFAKI